MGKKNYGDPRQYDKDLFGNYESETNLLTHEQLMDLYDEYTINLPQCGQIVNVTFVGYSEAGYNFDGGFKDFLRIEDRQSESKYLQNIEIGDNIDVLIVEVDENNYQIRGSLVELYETRAREILLELEEGSFVEGFVKELTPAGYNVDLSFEGVTLAGFMPNTLAGINKLHNPESIIGKRFQVMIESYSNEEGTYIVSRRKYLQSLIPNALKQLENNKIYIGHVTGTTEFGVFVEFNECLTGMIHKTNMHTEWQDRISQITPGVGIEFYIKEIIRDKIILTQILRETLWDSIKIGQVLDAKIKDVKPFGVLVILDDETNGLIHSSEVEKSNQKLQPGNNVKVKVISIDRMNRKIFLTVA